MVLIQPFCHTRFELCNKLISNKLISQNNPKGKWVLRVKEATILAE